jgi:hypothetical protein
MGGFGEYERSPFRANILPVHIGGPSDPAGTGGVADIDFWHVDLWGWALPDHPYISRSLYGNNMPDTTINGDEHDFVNRILVFLPSTVVAPAIEANSLITPPYWNQISIRPQAVERAWALPKQLIANGSIPATPVTSP